MTMVSEHDSNMMAVLFREEGRSLEDLARMFGRAVATVRRGLLKRGVEMRSRGRRRREDRDILDVGEAVDHGI